MSGMSKSCKVAVFDLGTQTFRVVGAKVTKRGPEIIFSLRKNVRLGKDLLETGEFRQDAIKSGIDALLEFKRKIEKEKIEKFLAIGTEAFRRSKNSPLFLKKARKLGIAIDIISPQKEAELAVRGAYLTVPELSSPWAMIDLGGGSTEIVFCKEQRPEKLFSLSMGAVSVHEMAQKRKIVDFKGFRLFVEEFFLKEIQRAGLKKQKVNSALATGGTATTVAAVLEGLWPYDPKRVRGYKVSLDQLEDLLERIFSLSAEKRKTVKGLEPERADIFPTGIAILIEIIRYLDLKKITISDGGILFGFLAFALEKECGFYVEPSSARSLYI